MDEMEIIRIPGNAAAFKAFVDEHVATNTIELKAVEGKLRWVVTEDGSEYVAVPSHVEHEWWRAEEKDDKGENTGRIMVMCKSCNEVTYE